MRQDNESELVLGNKQLLSLFFVAAALCGVCFAIGYMVGRNTSKASISASDQPPGGTTEGRRQQPDAPTESHPQPAEPALAAPTETKPAVDAAPASDAKSAETLTATAEPKAYVEAPKSKSTEDPLSVATPEVGASYLQVSALPRPDAEGVVKTLREQQFPVIMALSSKQGFYRVLVGPYRHTVALSDAKSKLKALGFNGAFVPKQ